MTPPKARHKICRIGRIDGLRGLGICHSEIPRNILNKAVEILSDRVSVALQNLYGPV